MSRDADRTAVSSARPRLLLIVAWALIPAGRASAGEPDRWLGTQVVLKSPSTALRVGDRAVAGRGAYRLYRVERVEDGRLWITPGAGSPGGWVKAEDLVPQVEAIRYFSERIRDEPGAAWAYHRRAMAWLDRHETDIAIADYTEAIELDPKDPLAHANRGLAWLEKKDPAMAIADFDEAIRLDPGDAGSYDQRGLARSAGNELDKAIADFDEAIRLDPGGASAYGHRGMVRVRMRQYDGGLGDYSEAIRLDPADSASSNGLAWLLATCPVDGLRDGKRGVDLATRANDLTDWESPYYLGTLAAAHAEAGDFDAAVKWQANALKRFPDADPDLQGHRARLELYRAKQSYREGQPRS